MNTSCQITKKYSENLMEHKFGRGYRRSIFTSMFFFNDDRLDRFLSSQGFLSLGLKFSFNLTWLKEADHPRHETIYSNIISPLPPLLPSLPFWREFKNQASHLIHLLISHRTHAIWTMKRTMAFRELSCILFVCFFALGNAIYCLEASDCSALESCCPDYVCRERCYVCSYDYQCGSNEHCCKSKCISGLPSCSCSHDDQCDIGEECCAGVCSSYCGWSSGTIAGVTIGSIVFFAIIISIVSCLCCASRPYYRYRVPGAVIVTQQPQQQHVLTQANTMMTQHVQAPPLNNYNQPPSGFR